MALFLAVFYSPTTLSISLSLSLSCTRWILPSGGGHLVLSVLFAIRDFLPLLARGCHPREEGFLRSPLRRNDDDGTQPEAGLELADYFCPPLGWTFPLVASSTHCPNDSKFSHVQWWSSFNASLRSSGYETMNPLLLAWLLCVWA